MILFIFYFYILPNMPFHKRNSLFTKEEFNELSKQLQNYYKKKRPELLLNIECNNNEISSYINKQNKIIQIKDKEILDLKLQLENMKDYANRLYYKNKEVRKELLEAADEISELKLEMSSYY